MERPRGFAGFLAGEFRSGKSIFRRGEFAECNSLELSYSWRHGIFRVVPGSTDPGTGPVQGPLRALFAGMNMITAICE